MAAFEFENNDDAHIQTLSADLPQETIEDRSNAAIHELKEKAEKLENVPIDKFLKTLNNWKDKVLNFFHKRHTNAVVEGLNNAVRGIIRRSFGFHSFDNLRRRVLVELG